MLYCLRILGNASTFAVVKNFYPNSLGKILISRRTVVLPSQVRETSTNRHCVLFCEYDLLYTTIAFFSGLMYSVSIEQRKAINSAASFCKLDTNQINNDEFENLNHCSFGMYRLISPRCKGKFCTNEINRLKEHLRNNFLAVEMSIPPPAPSFVFRGDTSDVHSLLFYETLDKQMLFAGCTDGTVQTWDLVTNKKISSFKTSTLACLSLHFMDSNLLTQDKSCHLKVWTLQNDSPSCIYEKNFNNFSFCKINVLRNKLAVPQPNSIAEIHKYVLSTTCLFTRLSHPDESLKLGEVQQLKLFDHKSSLFAAVVYENGSLTIWNAAKSEVISNMKITSETPMAFDFDEEKLQGVCGSNEKDLVFFKLDEQLKLTKIKEIEITNAGVGCLRVRPDKKVLAAGCWDGKVRIFSWKTCKLLAALDCHRASILDVAFTSGKQRSLLIASASDKKISLWNIFD